MNVLVRSPKVRSSSRLPALYYIVGGGFFTTYCDMNEIERICKEFNCVVIVPLPRMGKGHLYPSTINDISRGLPVGYEHAGELGINEDNITIFGFSVGGGLACHSASAQALWLFPARHCGSHTSAG
jgi:acetyl esterase/lipase